MANGIDWFRWHHGTVNDPKFQLVARKSGSTVAEVIAVWACLLEAASAADERGNPGEIDFEALDCALGLSDGRTQAIYMAMNDRALVNQDTGRLAAWEKRQPKRERMDDDKSTDRVRAYRQRQASAGNANKEDGTPRNAMERQETPREEKSREERKEENTLSGKPDGERGEMPGLDDVKAPNVEAREILEHLNARTGCHYRAVESNLGLIRARLGEGYSIHDVKAVIDAKVAEWQNKPEMAMYLRPETLFGARKFSGYVGQVERTAPGAGWWIKAGFGTPFEAENAGCSEKTAYLWRDGHRMEATA
ncbi:conserved phage C-terminal domain-containing protein [Achromobacter xylosoxidans]|uniref:conserved phage C-terminal domain-containing protein n=1 Tax=Alcaligenes xylosoxydans xylosoxydans TaxID=85698 RepID=UPI003F76CCE4